MTVSGSSGKEREGWSDGQSRPRDLGWPAVEFFKFMGKIGGLKGLCKLSNARRVAQGLLVVEMYNLFPREFVEQFRRVGINIEEYKIPLRAWRHRLKPYGIHTGSDNWNKHWEVFFEEDKLHSDKECFEFLQKLREHFRI